MGLLFAPNGIVNMVVRDGSASDAFPGSQWFRPITSSEERSTSVAVFSTPSITIFGEAREQQNQALAVLEPCAARRRDNSNSSGVHTAVTTPTSPIASRRKRNFLVEYEVIHRDIAIGGQGAISIIQSKRNGMTFALKVEKPEENFRKQEVHRKAIHKEIQMLQSCGGCRYIVTPHRHLHVL